MTPSKAVSDLVFMVSCASCSPIGVSITSFQSPSRAMSQPPTKRSGTAPADASGRRPPGERQRRSGEPCQGARPAGLLAGYGAVDRAEAPENNARREVDGV